MTRIMKKCWDANKDKLRNLLAERTDLNGCEYNDLVKLTFETIYNAHTDLAGYPTLNVDNITIKAIMYFFISSPFNPE